MFIMILFCSYIVLTTSIPVQKMTNHLVDVSEADTHPTLPISFGITSNSCTDDCLLCGWERRTGGIMAIYEYTCCAESATVTLHGDWAEDTQWCSNLPSATFNQNTQCFPGEDHLCSSNLCYRNRCSLCWIRDTLCLWGTTCRMCCDGYSWFWNGMGFYCL